jgi:hypothetical protein
MSNANHFTEAPLDLDHEDAATPFTEATASKLARVYNQYLVDLIMDVKQIGGDAMKTLLRQSNNKTIDAISLDYVASAARTVNRAELVGAYSSSTTTTTSEPGRRRALIVPLAFLGGFEPLPGVTVASLIDIVKSASFEDEVKVHMYLHVLVTLCVTHLQCLSGGEAAQALVEYVLQSISEIQQSASDWTGAAGTDEIGDVDDIVMLLSRLGDLLKEDEVEINDDQQGGTDFESALEGSQIANLAREVAKDIDISELMQSFASMGEGGEGGGGGGAAPQFDFSKLINTVGSKIQTKLASGEIKQQDFMQEALGLMSSFNPSSGPGSGLGGDMMGGILKTMFGNNNKVGGGGNKTQVHRRKR